MTAHLDSLALLRYGGLPLHVVDDLRDPALAAWARQYNQATAAYDALIAEVVDQLEDEMSHDVAGGRGLLLDLRRSVSHHNAKQTEKIIEKHSSVLPATLWESCHRVLSYDRLLEHLRFRGSTLMEWSEAREGSALSLLEFYPEFTRALALSAPGAVDAVHRYSMEFDTGQKTKVDRKVERTLVEYVLRAAVKTSPFSSFTPTAIISVSSRGLRNRIDVTHPEIRKTRWNTYVAARILDSLRSRTDVVADMAVQISEGLKKTADGSYRLWRSRWAFFDTDVRLDGAANSESSILISEVSGCEEVLAIVRDGARKVKDILAGLQRAHSAEEAKRLLTHYLDLGVLEIGAFDEHPGSAMSREKALSGLAESPSPVARSIGVNLIGYREDALKVADLSSAHDRVWAIGELRSRVHELYQLAGVSGDEPRSVVFEDCATNAELTSPYFEVGEADLALLVNLSRITDRSQLSRAVMKGYFEKRCPTGACTTVMDFLYEFRLNYFDAIGQVDFDLMSQDELASTPWLQTGEAWRWAVASRALFDLVMERISAARSDSLDISDLLTDGGSVMSLVPEQHFPYQHLHCFGQLVQHRPYGFVVNRVFGAPGFAFSRFAYLYRCAGTQFTRDIVERASDAGVTLAELPAGAAVTNLNCHEPLLPTEIWIPGEPMRNDPRVRQVRLDEMRLVYRVEQNRLALLGDSEEEFLPSYLGYLIYSAIPATSQLLGLVSPPTSAQIGFAARSGAFQPLPGNPVWLPEIRIGTLLLQRRSCRVHGSDLPSVNDGPVSRFLQWVSLWDRIGLPEETYVRVYRKDRTRSKPLFVDLANLASLRAFSSVLEAESGEVTLVFEEAVPAQREALAFGKHSGRVHEYILGFDVTPERRGGMTL